MAGGGVSIRLEGLRKRFGAVDALGGVDLYFEPGTFVCLLGPSGCGKTTLLRCIAGLERPDGGRVRVGDEVVVDAAEGVFMAPEKRGLGMVFQQYALWPHMTVVDNIAYPLKRRGVDRRARLEAVRDMAELVGLREVLDRHPGQLSGGQQQRVALARALIHEPSVLLLDEPLSNLDAALRRQLQRELRRLHERLSTTMIHVTHDQEEAAALADVVVVMDQGLPVQMGTPAQLRYQPATRFVAEFMGFDNFLRGVIVREGRGLAVRLSGGSVLGTVPAEHAGVVGDEVVLAVRSGSLAVAPADSAATAGLDEIDGMVRQSTAFGDGVEHEIECGPDLIAVREGYGAQTLPSGQAVRISVPEEAGVLLGHRPHTTTPNHEPTATSGVATPTPSPR